MWIIVDNGRVFEGTLEQFQGLIFSNANRETIQEWASKDGHEVIFVDEPRKTHKCKYCDDTGMVTLFSFSKPCLDCPPLSSQVSLPDEVVWAKCHGCKERVCVSPETWGYELLRDRGYCLARCDRCDGGRTFVRI